MTKLKDAGGAIVFHIEANGGTNTAEYVSKMLAFEKQEGIQSNVYSSHASIYETTRCIPVFGTYPSHSGIGKALLYTLGLLRVAFHCRSGPCIIHFHWPKLPAAEYLIMGMLKKFNPELRIVQTVHNIEPHEPTPTHRLFGERWFKLVDGFVYHSVGIQNKHLSRFPWLASNKKLITKIIPHYHYVLGSEKPLTANGIFLFAGSVRKYKGVFVLLEAVERLKKMTSLPWHMVIAGKVHPEAGSLEAEVKKRVLSQEITLRDKYLTSEELDETIHAATALVLPYLEVDNSGLVHYAMSKRRAVIASKAGCLNEYINENTGFSFETGNAEELALRMKQVLESPQEELQMIADNAYAQMVQNHGSHLIGSGLRSFYEEMGRL